MKSILFVTSQTILYCTCRSSAVVRLVNGSTAVAGYAVGRITIPCSTAVTVGLGHRVYRKLYTLIGGQRAEKFESRWSRVSKVFCQRDT